MVREKGEVLGLLCEDIDLENNIIKIRRNLVRKKIPILN